MGQVAQGVAVWKNERIGAKGFGKLEKEKSEMKRLWEVKYLNIRVTKRLL